MFYGDGVEIFSTLGGMCLIGGKLFLNPGQLLQSNIFNIWYLSL